MKNCINFQDFKIVEESLSQTLLFSHALHKLPGQRHSHRPQQLSQQAGEDAKDQGLCMQKLLEVEGGGKKHQSPDEQRMSPPPSGGIGSNDGVISPPSLFK